MDNQLKEKPNMSFWGLWNLSFGFFGVQIAYALQSANISRIRYVGCRSALTELLLDPPAADGYPRAADRG